MNNTCCPSHSVLQNSDLKNVHKHKCSSLSFHYQKTHYSRRGLRLKLNTFYCIYTGQKSKHWKKQIKTVFQLLMYIVNAFKCTKSICQYKSLISSAVFSNSSFTISLLHHWEYTERTEGSLILLTHTLLSTIMQFPHTVFLYYLSLGSNKLGS